MNIAVIGAGNVGGALAKNWAKAGHKVIIGSRNAGSDELKTLSRAFKNLSAASIENAVNDSEVILVSIPVQAATEVASQIGDAGNKIIIDATNSVFAKPKGYNNCFELFKDVTRCNDLVKCFNSTGFENMENPIYGDLAIDMFMAGDSLKAKETALKLAKDCGFENCYDFGGDDCVQLLEQFAMSWINLAILQKQGRDIAFKIIRR